MSQDRDTEEPTRRYVCIGYFDQQAMDELAPEEMNGILSKCGPHMASMYASNGVVLDAGLSNQAWWIRRMNDAVKTTDGPYGEAKECIGSVLLIEARSDEEALSIAKLHPSLQLPEAERLGWRMAVRPVHYFHAPEHEPRSRTASGA